MIKCFAKIVNQPLTIFVKPSIVDVLQGPKNIYATIITLMNVCLMR